MIADVDGVTVFVGVCVGVFVKVGVGVGVDVLVGVIEGVGVCVDVLVGVIEGVGVCVGVTLDSQKPPQFDSSVDITLIPGDTKIIHDEQKNPCSAKAIFWID
jgi:hypothetical protein